MDEQPEIKRDNKKRYIKGIIIILLLAFFGFGYLAGLGRVKIGSEGIEINRGNTSLSADYSLLWDTLDALNTQYVDRPLDQQALLFGAVSGLVDAAGDPYTVFFDPEESKLFQDGLNGTFEGIGAEIGIKDGQLVVIAPLDDTPASKAGLRAGDTILAIDGESSVGMGIDQAVLKIRGDRGTEVVLTVIHQDESTPEEIRIIRDKIVVESLKFEIQNVNDKKIAIIKLNRFGEDTNGLFNRSVERILTEGFEGIVIDLRNNPGGFLETAIDLASNWISTGEVVVKEVNYLGQVKDYDATIIPRLRNIKTVVLVDGGSASASEILAGALQDYKLATVVGETTFGKGSVQELTNLKGDSTLKITVAKWQTPLGRSIHGNGLDPDVVVEMTDEDFDNDLDPQMDKALELFE